MKEERGKKKKQKKNLALIYRPAELAEAPPPPGTGIHTVLRPYMSFTSGSFSLLHVTGHSPPQPLHFPAADFDLFLSSPNVPALHVTSCLWFFFFTHSAAFRSVDQPHLGHVSAD